MPGGMTGAQQPCNPVIDGTYCASQPIRRPSQSAPGRSGVTIQPVQSIANDLSLNRDQPGTFGAISFQGSSTCIGLLRRGACR
jgi:hypothetical protein